MKISFWVIAKTSEKYITEGISIYKKRLKHYTNFDYLEFKVKSSGNSKQVKSSEADSILSKLQKDDYLVLLDEKGNDFTSRQFAANIENKLNQGSVKRIVYVVGGAYGFDDKLYQRANEKLSLSKMTFSHQMIRVFFVEQLYRAFTIIRGEKYHND